MMGVTMLQYAGVPSPLGEARQSSRIMIPEGAASVQVYAVASQNLYSQESFRLALSYGLSPDGREWTESGTTNATGASDSIAPHAAGMSPGQIVADTDENFEFVAESAASLGGALNGANAEMRWLRMTLVPIAGGGGNGVFVAAVAEAFDADGAPMIWDTSTRAA